MKVGFQGPAGPLEGVLETPDDGVEPVGVAVVCHPHPLHGGTQANTIVVRTARALRAAGCVTLRFNFRGVGASGGVHHGEGGAESEEGDVAAGLELLASRYPGLPAWAAGYSFGARTVLGLATREERIERLFLIALPVAFYDCSGLLGLRQPGLLLFGNGDEFGTVEDLSRSFPALPGHLEVREVDGADHLFRGRTPLVEERVREYAFRAREDSR